MGWLLLRALSEGTRGPRTRRLCSCANRCAAVCTHHHAIWLAVRGSSRRLRRRGGITSEVRQVVADGRRGEKSGKEVLLWCIGKWITCEKEIVA